MIRLCAVAALCLLTVSVRAQVLEIGDDGIAREVGPGWNAPLPGAVADAPKTIPAMVPVRYREAVRAAAEHYDLSPWLIDAVARSESGYDADIVSPAGAIGIMQLMPDTARELGVDPRDPTQNVFGGAAYLRRMLDRFDGNLDLALAAYNAGSGRVVRYGGIPPFRETRDYVHRNLERLATRSDIDATPSPVPGLSPVPSPTGGAP